MNAEEQDQYEQFIVPELRRERAERLAKLEAELLGSVIGERLDRLEALVTGHRAGPAEEAMSDGNCRNIVKHETTREADDHDRLAFWRWKAAVILKIFEHPAMRADAKPVVVPHFDGLQWEEDFLSGMSVDEAVNRADAAFNRGGW